VLFSIPYWGVCHLPRPAIDGGLVYMAHICTGLKWSGQVVEVRAHVRCLGRHVGGGRRGVVRAWSRASRIRAYRTIAAVDWDAVGPLVMVTLTYRQPPTDGREVKRHMRAFRERWKRRFGGPVGVWKLEFQRRGAAHIHLWLQRPEVGLDELRQWVSEAWWEIVGTGDDVHRQAGTSVNSWCGSPVRYVRKYMAKGSKEYQHEVPEWFESVGRWWGLWGVRPQWRQVDISVESFYRIRRILRGLLRARARDVYVRARAKGRRVRMWRPCVRGWFSGVWAVVSSGESGESVAMRLCATS